jgi:pyridoxal phosphate enzyme (YggS family)
MDVKSNLQALRAKIPAPVTLVAVSKTQSAPALVAALEAGQRVFGENRVQEAYEHWESRRAAYPDLKLHLIGPLQTNKVKDALALFDVIETLDRPKLAQALAKAPGGQAIECYIQVNTGREPQKAGIDPYALPGLYAECRNLGLNVTGLMCIPPADEDPAPHFKALAAMAKDLSLKHLSMGMSADFETAIACGATHVRVGSALFGQRQAL